MIDLRSDTVTKPSKEMRAYMADAPVGDDAYGEDESVNLLQDYCKKLFQKEDALFVTSGMMANRLAFLSQTNPGDEVITDYTYHVNFFDSAPMAFIAKVVMNTWHTTDGILRPHHIEEALHSKQRYEYFAQPKLVSIENSINGWAGKIFPFEDLKAVYNFAKQKGLSVHLDGARLFNAHVATGVPLADYASNADSLSVCFSKGLGAPYGSMLMGSRETINKARRFRIWLGGGVHQAGMQAAAAYYAVTHHIDSVKRDHELAKYLAQMLLNIPGVSLNYDEVETNMVQIIVGQSDSFLDQCAKQGLLLFPWVPGVVRAVINRHITREDIEKAASIIKTVVQTNEQKYKLAG